MVSIIAQHIVNCKNKLLEMHNILYFYGKFCHKRLSFEVPHKIRPQMEMSVYDEYCMLLEHGPMSALAQQSAHGSGRRRFRCIFYSLLLP